MNTIVTLLGAGGVAALLRKPILLLSCALYAKWLVKRGEEDPEGKLGKLLSQL